MHENNLSLFISQIHFNRLWKMCFFNADILVKNLNLLIYSNYTPVYNFIYDIFAAKSAALKPLSQHLILCTFRYFLRKWQKYLAADLLTYLKKKILYTFGMALDKVFILIRQNIHSTIIKLCFTWNISRFEFLRNNYYL